MDLNSLIGTIAAATSAQEEAAEKSENARASFEEVTSQLNLYHDLLRSCENPGEWNIKRLADAFLNAPEKQFPVFSKGGRQISQGQIIAMLDVLTRFYREGAGMCKELTT